MCATPDACAADRAAARVGAGSRDGVPWAIVVGSLTFEEREHAFGAVGCPRGDEAPVGLAQGLRGEHRPCCH